MTEQEQFKNFIALILKPSGLRDVNGSWKIDETREIEYFASKRGDRILISFTVDSSGATIKNIDLTHMVGSDTVVINPDANNVDSQSIVLEITEGTNKLIELLFA